METFDKNTLNVFLLYSSGLVCLL